MPRPSPADSTRNRILDAATAEFARSGIAGARIDRIAKSASTSKERVYAYFRSKEALYSFITARELDAVAAATQMDPADLPGYAGRVHDYFVANPESRRLMRWGALEFVGTDGATRRTAERKTDTLRRAQQQGLLDPAWDPIDILMFVNLLAMAWADQHALMSTDSGTLDHFMADRRRAIVTAVERLFPAATPPPPGP